MKRLPLSIILAVLLASPVCAQIVSGTASKPSQVSTTVTSSQTFTTLSNVPTYKVIVVGDGGGGASSTGAGFGSDGTPGGLTECTVIGSGQAYVVAVGTGGAKGAAGAGGTAGQGSSIKVGTGAANCVANGGAGGTAGTASNAAAATGPAAATLANIPDASSPVNVFGQVFAGIGGPNGAVGGAASNTLMGVAGGVGCAGASCTTNTAGAAGKVIFIPLP